MKIRFVAFSRCPFYIHIFFGGVQESKSISGLDGKELTEEEVETCW